MRDIRSAPRATIPLGRADLRGRPPVDLVWDSQATLNGHMMLVGGSGSGKTHQLRRLIRHLAEAGMHVHVLDVHGDVVPDAPTDTIRFSESTAFGLNPLACDADPDFGGPRKKANAFINLMLRQAALGEKQKGALFRLLIDMYSRYGFDLGDPATWSLDVDPRHWAKARKRQPTLADLRKAVHDRLVSLKIGVRGAAVAKLDEVIKLQKQLHRLKIKRQRGEDVEDKLLKAKDAFLDAMAQAVDRLETGDELEELIAWDSPDVVKGLLDRIESLERSGIFKGRAPDFDPGRPVWRYDISPLSRYEAQFFVDCLAAELFAAAKQRGEAQAPDTAIVIDEAAIFLDRDDDHILNILAREGRKFGLMLILATQEISSFPQAVVGSAATKLLLGIDEMYHRATEDRLGLDRGKLRFIRPQQTALAQVKNRGRGEGLTNRFWEIALCDE